MKKALIFLAAMAMLTACSNDIDSDLNKVSDEIQFSVGNINATSLAASRTGEHNHIDWDDDIHANTLGVFGYGDGNLSNVMFSNQKVTYADEEWSYDPPKYWPEFTKYSSFYFFGYMLENADPSTADLPAATVTKDGNSYTLSFPATLTSPILTSGDNTPLICHAPQYTTTVGNPIPFQMDQTLTGYDIQFQLGEKMDALRKFVIKSVRIYGENLPVGGTVTRTYTFSDGTWTSSPVTWTALTTATVSATVPDPALDPDPATVPVVLTAGPITVNTHTDWVKWGASGLGNGAFYAIPHASFVPTIEVTYDVYTDTDGNGDGDTLDRANVTSTIVFENAKFGTHDPIDPTTGEIQHINIKIVPYYLYVLSDDDNQINGQLIDTPTP